MKLTPLLLTVSLAANAALVAVLLFRGTAEVAPPTGASTSASPATRSDSSHATLRATITSGDQAALEAAGLPAEVARQVVLGRAFSRFSEKLRAGQAAHEGRWWRNRNAGLGNREDLLLARRELSEAMRAAFGDDFGIGGNDTAQLSFLPAEKREALRRITQDYDEMMAKFSAGGIQLPSDREKLKLLREERDRDIAALLSPEERLAYEMRTSPTALTVRNRYGDGIESEEDFRKIYAVQKAFDEKFPAESLSGRVSPEVVRQRSEGLRQMQEELRVALGEEKYQALRRATDSDLKAVDALASRLGLPANTTDQVAATRETFAAESQRINADTSLNPAQRRAQIQELAARAKADLARTLGAEAVEAYGQRSSWLSLLQGGTAYSLTPQPNTPGALGWGAQTVFPVIPAGAPGNTRQVISIAGGRDEHSTAGSMIVQPSGTTLTRDNVHVMEFSVPADPAAGFAPRPGAIMVAPDPGAPASRVPAPKP